MPVAALGRVDRPRTWPVWASLLCLLACVFVAACTTFPSKAVIPYLTDEGAIGVKVFSIGRFHVVRYVNYLPGATNIEDLSVERFQVKRDKGLVQVDLYAADEATRNAARAMADGLLGVRVALNEIIPFPIDSLRLRVVALANDVRYAKTVTLRFSGNDLAATFALRVNKSSDSSARMAIRRVAHELVHVIMAIHGLSSKGVEQDGGSLEEEAAYMVENCIELRVAGSTSGDPLSDDEKAFVTYASSQLPPSNSVTSVVSRGRVSDRIAELFVGNANPITTDDPRARALGSLCKGAVDRLVTADRTHVIER